MRVLVMMDDGEYAAIVGEALRLASHQPVPTLGLDHVRQLLVGPPLELGVIDPCGPGGLDVLRALRAAAPGAGILCVASSARCAEVLAAFEAGADDYLVQPFHLAEFVARVNALGRRVAASVAAEGDWRGEGSGLVLDDGRGHAYFNGIDLGCTPLEFEIFRHMASVPGQPLPHAFLNARVWNYPNLTDGTLLKGHVSSLRRKLRAAGAGGMLRTVHGVGYRLGA